MILLHTEESMENGLKNTSNRPNAIDLRNKHAYVALSRASHHNYILFR